MENEFKGSFIVIAPDTIAGWVWCPTEPEKRVQYSILVNEKPVVNGIAEQMRLDLEKAGIGDGYHAFNLSVADFLNDGENQISVIAEDVFLLTGSPASLYKNATDVFPEYSANESSGLILRETRHGYLFLNTHDEGVDRCILEYGEWSPDEIDLFHNILQENDTALDVGANLGASALPMLDAVGKGGAVHAFEPQRMNYFRLCTHALLNGRPNLYPHQLAVTDSNSEEWVIPSINYNERHISGAVAISNANDVKIGFERVQTTSVDGFCNRNKISPRLIKIDVEGLELKAIEGAKETIKKSGCSVYFEAFDEQDFNLIVDIILRANRNYQFYWHAARLVLADNFNGSSADIYSGGGFSFNLLATLEEISIDHPGLVKKGGGREFWPEDKFPEAFVPKIKVMKKNHSDARRRRDSNALKKSLTEKHRGAIANLKQKTNTEIFNSIYKTGAWGVNAEGLGYSGAGSTGKPLIYSIEMLTSVIKSVAPVTSIVDIGCGDLSFGRAASRLVETYTGIDVSSEIIAQVSKGAPANMAFAVVDATEGPIPTADLVVIRQVLQHLTNDQILAVISRVKESKPKYVLIFEHVFGPKNDTCSNIDLVCNGPHTRVGYQSGVYLEEPPFSLSPEKVYEERIEDVFMRTILWKPPEQ